MVADKQTPILPKFGDAIRRLRKSKGLSQEEFADLCELDRSYIGGVERGQRNISLVNIEKICRALHVKFAEIFESIDNG